MYKKYELGKIIQFLSRIDLQCPVNYFLPTNEISITKEEPNIDY